MATTLNPQEFIALEKQAGFPQSAWAMGLATADVESDLRTNPPENPTHSGLFQIDNSYVGRIPGIKGPLSDPQTNVNDAYVLWKRAGGTFARDWQCQGCEPSGAAQGKLAWAQQQVATFMHNGGNTAGSPTGSTVLIGAAIAILLVMLVR